MASQLATRPGAPAVVLPRWEKPGIAYYAPEADLAGVDVAAEIASALPPSGGWLVLGRDAHREHARAPRWIERVLAAHGSALEIKTEQRLEGFTVLYLASARP